MKNKMIALIAIIIAISALTSCVVQVENTTNTIPSEKSAINSKDTSSDTIPLKKVVTETTLPKIEPAIQEILDKPAKISSIFYKYKGPETGENYFDVYIFGNNIRYTPFPSQKYFEKPESYDTIYLDKDTKSASAYCIGTTCKTKGKKSDLVYDEVYIPTIFDWVSGLTFAEKVGEEVVDNSQTIILNTSKGTEFITSYYGFPLKVESFGKTYKYAKLSVNSVKITEATPQ